MSRRTGHPAAGLCGLVLCLLPLAARGQSVSMIGQYLDPWADQHFGGNSRHAMTADGKWIIMAESLFNCGSLDQISMIRTDGTDFRVIMDHSSLEQLKEESTEIRLLEISGDGRRLAFWWPHKITWDCHDIGPGHWFLVDVESGAAEEFRCNDMPVGGITFTDDGETMCFAGFDAAAGKYLWFTANADGSNPVPFLDPTPWYVTFGRISGDGSTFLMIGYHGPYPFPGDAYVHDIEGGVTTKVSAQTTNLIRTLSISADGSRLLYGGHSSPLYGVESDGSDHHLIKPDWTSAGGVAITRDGRSVFYQDGVAGGPPVIRKARWDGTIVATIEGVVHPNAGNDTGQIPVGANGAIVGIRDAIPISPTWVDIGVWHELSPFLTTYGHGVPGTELHCDVAGQPGDAFILAFAFAGASVPFRHYGTLGLDPRSLGILTVGAIPLTGSVASIQTLIPASAVLPDPTPIYLQALVFDGVGPTGRLTNTPVFTVDMVSDSYPLPVELPMAQVSTGDGDPGAGLDGRAASAASSGAGDPETPEDHLERLLLMDPALWWRLEQERGRSR